MPDGNGDITPVKPILFYATPVIPAAPAGTVPIWLRKKQYADFCRMWFLRNHNTNPLTVYASYELTLAQANDVYNTVQMAMGGLTAASGYVEAGTGGGSAATGGTGGTYTATGTGGTTGAGGTGDSGGTVDSGGTEPGTPVTHPVESGE